MGLYIAYITNGRKDAFAAFDNDTTPGTATFYEQRDEIPAIARHLAPESDPEYYGPNKCRTECESRVGTYELFDYFYPDHPNCNMPTHEGTFCLAEACLHAPDDSWPECEYLDA